MSKRTRESVLLEEITPVDTDGDVKQYLRWAERTKTARGVFNEKIPPMEEHGDIDYNKLVVDGLADPYHAYKNGYKGYTHDTDGNYKAWFDGFTETIKMLAVVVIQNYAHQWKNMQARWITLFTLHGEVPDITMPKTPDVSFVYLQALLKELHRDDVNCYPDGFQFWTADARRGHVTGIFRRIRERAASTMNVQSHNFTKCFYKIVACGMRMLDDSDREVKKKQR
jgi:hypothetical protein